MNVVAGACDVLYEFRVIMANFLEYGHLGTLDDSLTADDQAIILK